MSHKPDKAPHAFGNNCRHIREVLGLSMRELSKRAGVTEAAICQIENGQRDPQLATALAIAKGLGAKLHFLGTSVRASSPGSPSFPSPKASTLFQRAIPVLELNGAGGGSRRWLAGPAMA